MKTPYYEGMPYFLSPASILAMLLALSVHEWAHGYAAYLLGDPTAKYEGRLTLNPLVHLDPIGTILFLLVGFGWGKPVPVNPRYFSHYRRDTALVALAGPVSNIVIAILASLLLLLSHSLGSISVLSGIAGPSSFLFSFFEFSIALNLTLMAFNLLPIAPLDGSKILAAFIPLQYDELFEQYMSYGPFILLFLLLSDRFLGFDVFSAWISIITMPFFAMLSVIFRI